MVKYKMLFLFIFLAIFFLVIIIFAFPRFSPIPYYPTNWGDINKIVNIFPKDNEAVLDLGAGSGTVLFALAKEAHDVNRKTKFIALEINPFLILLLYVKRLFHPNKKNIIIYFGDLFKVQYDKMTHDKKSVCYLYVSPRLIPQIVKKIKKDIPSSQIVSYMYAITDLKPTKIVKTGNHPIYLYNKI